MVGYIYAGDQLITTVEGNGLATTTHYVYTDHLGGSSVITDGSGNLEQLLVYYPYGGIRLDERSSSFDEKHKFTGYTFDSDTNLNYAGARYQNGSIGKFISIDPAYLAVGDDEKLKDKTGLELSKYLENPQNLNTPRTMGKLNSASEFSSQKNTRSKNKSISIQDEYLAKRYNWDEYLINPQLQNSYSYAANNPLKYVDPNGETPALALPLAIPATEAIIAAAGTAVAAVTGVILSQTIRAADPGNFKMDWRGLPTERAPFDPKAPDPKAPKWVKIVWGTITAIGTAVGAKLGWDELKSEIKSFDQKIQEQRRQENAPRNPDGSKQQFIRAAN